MASKNLTLGKGEVHFAQFAPGTQNPTGYLFLGNCPEFTLTTEVEELDHFSSTSGLREKDESIVVQRDMGGSIVCDDINLDNLALFFMGAKSTVTTASATGVIYNVAGAKPGRSYQLGESDALPGGYRLVTAVVVTDDTSPTPVTFDLGDDYTLDAALGIVTIVEGGAITDGTNLVITFNVTASTRDRVISGDAQIEGALKFISYNPVGQRLDYYIPWVKVRSNGDFSLISEEWNTIPLNIEALKKGNQALVYLDGRAVV